MDPKFAAEQIKEWSRELGFLSCGISKAEFLEPEASHLDEWLKRGYHGKMKWMENHFDKRLDPSKLVPSARSVISLLFNYYPEQEQEQGTPGISKYAYGDDYHHVIKGKMRALTERIAEHTGEFNFRYFVDSAPVLERPLAARAGLGWIGKHSLLLSKQKGSFFFIGNIICDLELEMDGPTTDHCGNCTACMDACPTDAIVADQVVDARKCISYLTIELRDEIPQEFQPNMENWAFGCDICQDVCPWNRFSTPHSTPEFSLKEEVRRFTLDDWQKVDEAGFKRIFKRSAVRRTGFEGFRRNLRFISPNGGKE